MCDDLAECGTVGGPTGMEESGPTSSPVLAWAVVDMIVLGIAEMAHSKNPSGYLYYSI